MVFAAIDWAEQSHQIRTQAAVARKHGSGLPHGTTRQDIVSTFRRAEMSKCQNVEMSKRQNNAAYGGVVSQD